MVPSSALGLHLLDREFQPCLQYWLGLPIFYTRGRCPVCQALADPFGDHHVGCGGNGDRIHRHNSIRDAIFSAAQTAALAPRKELPSLIPGSQARPADMFLPNWERDVQLHLMLQSSQLCSRSLSKVQPLHQAMPWLSGRTGKWLCMLRHARLWGYPLSHLSSSRLGAGAILQQRLSPALVVSWVNGWASFHLTLFITCFRGVQFHSGGGTPLYGYNDIQPFPHT